MKLISFEDRQGDNYGAVVGDSVISLKEHFGARAPTLRSLLGAGLLAEAEGLTSIARPGYVLSDLRLLPVIPNPDKIICVGLNYLDHVQETGRSLTDYPVLFSRFSGSQVGHLQSMIRPKVSSEFDYEGELAVVIGKPGRHIAAEHAMSYVAGYSCYNDGSVRDWQRHTHQFLPGKTFSGTGSFGPWLVTSDEIPDVSRLTLETRLNGVTVQTATTNLMITPIPSLIAYISTILPLLPGDVVVTGTPGGVGAKRSPQLWMKPGDVAEVEISGVGCLRNFIIDEA